MNSLAMETTYSVLLPKLAMVHYFEPLNSNFVMKTGFPKIQVKMIHASLVFHVNVFQGVSHSKL